MTNEQIFERHFKEGMIVNDFKAFKKSHPTLLKCILNALNEKNAVHHLFVGKVADEIGFERTVELLTETKKAFQS